MLFAALVFLCVMILTVTHVLDGSLRRSGIHKSHFLIFNCVFFLASLAPPFGLNRYFSLQADAVLMLACFVVLLFYAQADAAGLQGAFGYLLYLTHFFWYRFSAPS